MNLRLDHLLDALRDDPAAVLARIDADPLLVKRVAAGGLVLANAGPLLFTPAEPHQLYAKGVVYRREPYAVVSLPLVKIYNLGERSVSVADVAGLAAEPDAKLHFLRKFDGTLIQRFQHAGRVYLTTRGMIEGAAAGGPPDDESGERQGNFDYLGSARRLAAARYPALLEARPELEGVSLVFEFLHPRTRVITDYGGREDLVLLAAFDRGEWRYRTYAEVLELASMLGLTPVDALTPAGDGLAEQLDSLLRSLAGTDEEGAVVVVEHGHRVVYRVKVKSPDYLRVLKLVVTCTYGRVVEMFDAHPEWSGWPPFEAHLRELGRERVPEEVLGFYREHYEAFAAYLADCETLRARAAAEADGILRDVGDAEDRKAARKAFAARAMARPLSPLLFAAFDGRLSVKGVRALVKTPAEARAAVERPGVQ